MYDSLYEEATMKRIMTFLACLFILLGFITYSYAILIDIGGGFIYDDDRNITWLYDANYAYTSGWDPDGRMTWDEANAFVAAINTGSINNFGYGCVPFCVENGISRYPWLLNDLH